MVGKVDMSKLEILVIWWMVVIFDWYNWEYFEKIFLIFFLGRDIVIVEELRMNFKYVNCVIGLIWDFL